MPELVLSVRHKSSMYGGLVGRPCVGCVEQALVGVCCTVCIVVCVINTITDRLCVHVVMML